MSIILVFSILYISYLVFDVYNRNNINYDNINFDIQDISLTSGIGLIVSKLFHEIKTNNIHPNDVCILGGSIYTLQCIDYIIRNNFNEKTTTTFESIELKNKIKLNKVDETLNLRKSKKIGFKLNSGLIKLSTIQSFKGFESKVVFLIINENDEYKEGHSELLYTGISRCKSELMIFAPKNSKYNEFFNAEMKNENSTDNTILIEELKDCIAKEMCIDILYDVHSGSVEYKQVKPYKILFMNDNFYLATEVNMDYKFTMFRISKIKNIILSDNKFYKNPDIVDFVNNIQTPFAKYKSNYKEYLVQVKVEVHHSKAEYFKIKQFLPSQEIIEIMANGNLIISFTVTQEMEVEELIKKWLPFLRVLEPLTLDEKIRNDIKEYLN